MLFNCQKEELLEALNVVSKAISTRSAMPILEGVYLSAHEGGLTVVGNDNELGIECTISAHVYEEGKIVLIAKTFIDMIRKLPNDLVQIKVDSQNFAVITCQNIEYKILGLSSDEFPAVPNVESNVGFTLESATLKNMIRRTIFAIATNESRIVLTGSLFEIAGDTIKIVSVDGFRLALREEKLKKPAPDAFNFIVPGKTLSELSKILKDDDSPVEVVLSDHYVLLKTENAKIVSRLIEGTFLNYEKTIPPVSKFDIEISIAEVLESVERCEPIIATDNAKSPVRLILKDSTLTIKCVTNMGQVSDSVMVAPTDQEIEIGFNHKYLHDALKACEEEKAKLEFTSNLSPCLIRPVEGNSFLQMVLPVRLKND